jgi:pilus assembly protein CpaF
MAGFELPIRATRQQIALALDVIVATARMNDGSRKITSITEVVGMEGDTVMLQDLFVFQREGTDENGRITGRFTPTGIRPRFADNLKATSQTVDSQALDYLRN